MTIEYTHEPVPDQNMEPPEDDVEETDGDEGLDPDEQRDRDWDDAQDDAMDRDDYVDYGEGH